MKRRISLFARWMFVAGVDIDELRCIEKNAVSFGCECVVVFDGGTYYNVRIEGELDCLFRFYAFMRDAFDNSVYIN